MPLVNLLSKAPQVEVINICSIFGHLKVLHENKNHLNICCKNTGQNEKPLREFAFSSGFSGAPEGTRTPGLLVRSQSLYPTELLAHMLIVGVSFYIRQLVILSACALNVNSLFSFLRKIIIKVVLLLLLKNFFWF